MSGNWRDLAARLNAAVDLESKQKAAAEEARQARLAEGREARDQLFTDLAEFGTLLGAISVAPGTSESGERELTFKYRDQWIRFRQIGDSDQVEVSFDGSDDEEHRLFREPELAQRWVWHADTILKKDRHVLFTVGLEAMMTSILGMPDPTDHVSEPLPGEQKPEKRRL